MPPRLLRWHRPALRPARASNQLERRRILNAGAADARPSAARTPAEALMTPDGLCAAPHSTDLHEECFDSLPLCSMFAACHDPHAARRNHRAPLPRSKKVLYKTCGEWVEEGILKGQIRVRDVIRSHVASFEVVLSPNKSRRRLRDVHHEIDSFLIALGALW